MIHVWLAGVASGLPAASTARTSNVWPPWVSAGETVNGLEQEPQPPPSTRHSNVEPASFELKSNVGVVLPDGLAGLESIVVFGAVRSTLRVQLAGRRPVFEARSAARNAQRQVSSA